MIQIMKAIAFSMIVIVVMCVGCGGKIDLGEIQRASKLVVKDRRNSVVGEITDQSRISQILTFINKRHNEWDRPLFDTPVPRLIVDIYDGDNFVGHFGIARAFFEMHRHGEFVSTKASQSEVDDFLRLINVDRQLVFGDRLERENRDFESHWENRKSATKTLRVVDDFDFVVLGVGLGAIPYVCRELIERDEHWRELVTHCKTVATQAFQVWMREDMEKLAPFHTQTTVSGFVQPFDSWADMRQVIDEESWQVAPRAVAYFCSALPDAQLPADPDDPHYLIRSRQVVQSNATDFLDRHISHLWPAAVTSSGFRWELLMDPADPAHPRADRSAFDSQFWSANVNPSDRYSASLPGTLRYRISPLDNTYDNLTVAGDWTNCGFNEGCVEAAVMSGRLAAHAIAQFPRLEDIVGYDHP